MWDLTRQGIGVGNDAVVYLAGAENMYEGEGFTWFSGDGTPRPINHFPPLFSVLEGLAFPLAIPVLTWARLIQVALFSINIILIGLIIWNLTKSIFFAVTTILIFMVSEEVLALHSWAMSDSFFLTLVLLFLLDFARRQANELSSLRLVLLSMLTGLASLTRYIGVSLMGLLLLLILLNLDRGWREKWRGALSVLFFGALPVALWLGRNYVLTASLTNRQFGWYPKSIAWWGSIGETIFDWFLPGRITSGLYDQPQLGTAAAAFLVLAIGILVILQKRQHFRIRVTFQTMMREQYSSLMFFTLMYLAVMLYSAFLSYPDPDFSDRTLSPLYVSLLMLGITLLARASLMSNPQIKILLAIFPVLFFFFKLGSARYVIRQLSRDGQGYSSNYWRNSETIAALQYLDPDLTYTDNIGAVYFFTGKYAYNIPLKYDSVSDLVRSDFGESYKRMLERLALPNSALVLFSTEARLPEFASPDELTEELQPIGEYSDGSIYVNAKK